MPTITSQQELPKASAPTEPVAPVPAEALAPQSKPEPEKLSPQFSALARKEKALRLEAQKIKLEREALKEEQSKLKSSEYIPKTRLNSEFLQVLAEAGITHDQAANFLLNGQGKPQQDPMVSKLLARIEELENKTNKVETEFKDNQSKAYDQAVTQIRRDAKILVDSDPAYETIKASGRIEAVVKHIEDTYKEDGELLSVQEAAKEVEEALVEEAIKLAGVSKIKLKLQPEAPKPPEIQRQPHLNRTLTHDMTSAPSKSTLSAKDRYKRAVLRASGLDPDTGKPIAG